MKLLYLSAGEFPSRRANSIQIDAMCSAFAGFGHAVRLTGIRGSGPLDPIQGAYKRMLIRWPAARLRDRLLQMHACYWIALDRPDLCFTREAGLALTAARLGKRVMLELHSLPREGSRASRALARVLRHSALTAVVCISKGLAYDLARTYPTQRDGLIVHVAHDGAHAGPSPSPVPKDGPLRVGYFGHLYPGKGMELIASIAPRLPTMKFDVYGGAEEDLQRWRSTQLAENIRLHGHLPHHLVRAHMESCHVLLAPYGLKVEHAAGGNITSWMSPLKLFEYMAAGRPVVASDLPVIREVVTDGVNAALCSPADPEDWCRGLRQLDSDRERLAQLGASARQLLLSRYTWSARANELLAMAQ